jgi:KDO2-lipid IV(A) lauroyltransferase
VATARSPLLDELGFLPLRALRAALAGRDPDRALRIGASLGRAVARAGAGRSEIARINLELAFPDLEQPARERLLVESYANLGRTVAELALLQGPHRETVIERVRLEGSRHLLDAEKSSPTGGVIVLTAHFGSWDLCAAAMSAQGHPLSVVHRGFAHSGIERMMSEVRGGGRVPVDEVRMGKSAGAGVLRALREGRKVALLLDQNARRDEGVFVPFFSLPACTRLAPAVIAMKRSVPVLPVFVHRQPDGRHHVVRMQPALDIEPPGADPEAALGRNVARMTRVIESTIREAPEQWLWPHRRWRTRPLPPDGATAAPSIYPSRRRPLRRLRRAILR